MVSYSNSYSYGHDHSKTKSLEIRTKWQSFCSGIQWFLTKCPPFCSKWPPFCSKQNNIGKLNAFEKQKGGIPLELQMRLVFLPPLYCYDQAFQTRTIVNQNFKTFGIQMCLVFKCVWYSVTEFTKFLSLKQSINFCTWDNKYLLKVH